jgi:hypothetical protein
MLSLLQKQSTILWICPPSVRRWTDQQLPHFLDNHDDIDSSPIYIMDHNPITMASISPHWEQCKAVLPKVLPGMHGEGLPCLEYAAKHKRDEITAACSNFSTKDDFVGHS